MVSLFTAIKITTNNWFVAGSAPACKHQCVGKGGARVVRPLEVQESGLRFSFALSVSALGTIFSSVF